MGEEWRKSNQAALAANMKNMTRGRTALSLVLGGAAGVLGLTGFFFFLFLSFSLSCSFSFFLFLLFWMVLMVLSYWFLFFFLFFSLSFSFFSV